ncbi:MAG TPA: DUF423 domain-containing protein [Pirellulaceae bacterium]|nr:DUF423 domain-containing protein [Pirellulaceae bacterium]
MRRYQIWLLLGAVFGCLGVILGAIGAHGLEDYLRVQGGADSTFTEAEIVKLLANWETAARYQMYHALALLAVGFVAWRRCSAGIHVAGAAMTLGTLLFSGCLYVLVLSGEKWLGAIVPIGGLLMIIGWALLLFAVARLEAAAQCGSTP